MPLFTGGELVYSLAIHQFFFSSLSNTFSQSNQYKLLWLHSLLMIHTDNLEAEALPLIIP